MNWHDRYLQQAGWTRELRTYLFEKTGLKESQRILEVGCGTGAILSSLSTTGSIHGLDISLDTLHSARSNASHTILTNGDALALPYPEKIFDLTYCHFLLLWVKDPFQALLEMKRVTKSGGNLLALAEPDYNGRRNLNDKLEEIGNMQKESLRLQGADVGLGAHLAELFFRAGIHIIETGAIQGRDPDAAFGEHEREWAVLESDLAVIFPPEKIQSMNRIYTDACSTGRSLTDVPTYFVWGQV